MMGPHFAEGAILVALAVTYPPFCAWIASTRLIGGRTAWWLAPVGLMADGTFNAATDADGGYWLAAGISAAWVIAGIAWWLWRWRNRRRDGAKRQLGAKSRARRDALVRTMRELVKPRPVLRPVPGGAS